mgnify:FL=1|jgi:hypothetical protein|tara:strand:- start:2441 stop:2647 length:207 start_codon:yes stop_codon:yes gene_type:complete
MDIKTIAGIVGLVITLGGLFVQVGQILNRLEVVESRSVPNIVPLEKELSILKSQVEELKAKSSNPLMR